MRSFALLALGFCFISSSPGTHRLSSNIFYTCFYGRRCKLAGLAMYAVPAFQSKPCLDDSVFKGMECDYSKSSTWITVSLRRAAQLMPLSSSLTAIRSAWKVRVAGWICWYFPPAAPWNNHCQLRCSLNWPVIHNCPGDPSCCAVFAVLPDNPVDILFRYSLTITAVISGLWGLKRISNGAVSLNENLSPLSSCMDETPRSIRRPSTFPHPREVTCSAMVVRCLINVTGCRAIADFFRQG